MIPQIGGGNGGGPPIKDVHVGQEDYDTVFRPAYNEHGYAVTGPHETDFMEAGDHGEEFKGSYDAVYESLPIEFYDQVTGDVGTYTIVPEYNLKAHMNNHIMNTGHQEDLTRFDEMNESVREINP